MSDESDCCPPSPKRIRKPVVKRKKPIFIRSPQDETLKQVFAVIERVFDPDATWRFSYPCSACKPQGEDSSSSECSIIGDDNSEEDGEDTNTGGIGPASLISEKEFRSDLKFTTDSYRTSTPLPKAVYPYEFDD